MNDNHRDRRRPAAFRQIDVTRAIRAVEAAGVSVSRIEIEPGGRIVIRVGDESPPPETPFDQWSQKRNARPA